MKFTIRNVKNLSKASRFVVISAFITILIFGIVLLLTQVQRINAKGTDDCLTCHEDNDLTMEKNGKSISIYVNGSAYKGSVHGSMDCADCHTGYNPEAMPHSKTKVKIDCKTCHDNVKGIDASVHNKVECYACHSKHEIKPAKIFAKQQSDNCMKCHTGKNITAYKASMHGKKDVGCNGCHQGGHEVKKIAKNEVPNTCGKCHGEHQKNFNNSIHQVVIKSGNTKAPTCTDCHGSHQLLTTKMSIESQSCLKCHLNERMFPGEGRGSAKFVAEYKTSIHTSIGKDGKEAAGCSDCHGNHMIQKPDDPVSSTTSVHLPETCGKCHADVIEKFRKSAHGKALKDKNVMAPTCISCHSEHSIKSTRKSDEFSKLKQVDICLGCHLEGKLPHKNYKGEEVLISNYKESFHYLALKSGKTNAATCSDCHGSHEMNKFSDPNSRINRKNVEKTCGQSACHTKQLNEFTGSVHEVSMMTKENSDAPTCTSCHGNHQILKKDDKTNLISNAKGLVQLCSDCHNSVELVKKYSLPGGRTESYQNSFHGLAIRGGSKVAANCESCHGYHNIRASNDSLSTINKKNLPQTCGKCHPGAAQTLFNTSIHSSEDRKTSPVLFWIKAIYIFLIVATIGGMAVHNIIDLTKKVKFKNRVH